MKTPFIPYLVFSIVFSLLCAGSLSAQVHGEIYVLTDDYNPVKGANVFLKNNSDSLYNNIGLTNSNGYVEFSNYQIGIDDNMLNKNDVFDVYPDPATVHHFYAGFSQTTVKMPYFHVFDIYGRKIHSLKAVDKHNGIVHACWRPDELPEGMYICRFGNKSQKFMHIRGATEGCMANPTSVSLKRDIRNTDNFDAYACFMPGSSTMEFDSTASVFSFQEGYNSAQIIVQPLSYLHWYDIQTTPQAQVHAESSGHVFFSGQADSTGQVLTDSAYLDKSIDVHITAESPGKLPLDTSLHTDWNGQNLNLPLQDSVNTININLVTDSVRLQFILNGDTIAEDTAIKANTPDFSLDIDYNTTPYDSITIIQSKAWMNAIADTSRHAVNPGITSISLDGLDYVNDSVWSAVRRLSYNNPGSASGVSEYFIRFEGINVNHTDSMNVTNSMCVFHNIPIPGDGEGHPDTARFVRTITPTDTTPENMFYPYQDTVSITLNDTDIDWVYVDHLEQNVTLQGTVRGLYNQHALDSAKVRYRRASDSTILHSTITGPSGQYTFENIPCETNGFFEVGYFNHTASGYLSDVGHEYTIQEEIYLPSDSTQTVNWMLVPDSIPIPATPNDPNHNQLLPAEPDTISDMLRGPPESNSYTTDAEEASGRQVLLNYANMTPSQKQVFRDTIITIGDSLFYGIPQDVPIDDTSRPFKLITYELNSGNYPNYHPNDNYHPDSLGWNISMGGNTTYPEGYTPFDNGKQYGELATNGGDIEVSLSQSGGIKEIYGRSEHRQDVSGYPSFMNLNAAMPTLQDRAIIYLIHENEQQRLGNNSKTYYPLDKLEYHIMD